nr:MAG TPA: hypothetical protein [Caudoviricetes sp.]
MTTVVYHKGVVMTDTLVTYFDNSNEIGLKIIKDVVENGHDDPVTVEACKRLYDYPAYDRESGKVDFSAGKYIPVEEPDYLPGYGQVQGFAIAGNMTAIAEFHHIVKTTPGEMLLDKIYAELIANMLLGVKEDGSFKSEFVAEVMLVTDRGALVLLPRTKTEYGVLFVEDTDDTILGIGSGFIKITGVEPHDYFDLGDANYTTTLEKAGVDNLNEFMELAHELDPYTGDEFITTSI